MKSLRKFFAGGLIASFLILASTITVLAASNTKVEEYGAFTLTCKIESTSSYGRGSTSGAATLYKNYVAVTIYNENQVALGATYKEAESKVTLKLTADDVCATRTLHAVTDSTGYYVEPITQAIRQYLEN